jgi:hypothetical protein
MAGNSRSSKKGGVPYWESFRTLDIRISVGQDIPENGKIRICCTYCRAPITLCHDAACDDEGTYLGIFKEGEWVPVQKASALDPIQVAKDLQKCKQIGYTVEIRETTKDGKVITQRIEKPPQESPLTTLAKATRIQDIVTPILEVL